MLYGARTFLGTVASHATVLPTHSRVPTALTLTATWTGNHASPRSGQNSTSSMKPNFIERMRQLTSRTSRRRRHRDLRTRGSAGLHGPSRGGRAAVPRRPRRGTRGNETPPRDHPARLVPAQPRRGRRGDRPARGGACIARAASWMMRCVAVPRTRLLVSRSRPRGSRHRARGSGSPSAPLPALDGELRAGAVSPDPVND